MSKANLFGDSQLKKKKLLLKKILCQLLTLSVSAAFSALSILVLER